jgi:hypothetical protein
MFRKMLTPTMLAMLTLVASLGFARMENKLVHGSHDWGYVQQTQVVQG